MILKRGKYISHDNSIVVKPTDPGFDDYQEIETMPEVGVERIETIAANEDETYGIAFMIPKYDVEPGTYIFDLEVYTTSVAPENKYDKTQKIYIKVS